MESILSTWRLTYSSTTANNTRVRRRVKVSSEEDELSRLQSIVREGIIRTHALSAQYYEFAMKDIPVLQFVEIRQNMDLPISVVRKFITVNKDDKVISIRQFIHALYDEYTSSFSSCANTIDSIVYTHEQSIYVTKTAIMCVFQSFPSHWVAYQTERSLLCLHALFPDSIASLSESASSARPPNVSSSHTSTLQKERDLYLFCLFSSAVSQMLLSLVSSQDTSLNVIEFVSWVSRIAFVQESVILKDIYWYIQGAFRSDVLRYCYDNSEALRLLCECFSSILIAQSHEAEFAVHTSIIEQKSSIDANVFDFILAEVGDAKLSLSALCLHDLLVYFLDTTPEQTNYNAVKTTSKYAQNSKYRGIKTSFLGDYVTDDIEDELIPPVPDVVEHTSTKSKEGRLGDAMYSWETKRSNESSSVLMIVSQLYIASPSLASALIALVCSTRSGSNDINSSSILSVTQSLSKMIVLHQNSECCMHLLLASTTLDFFCSGRIHIPSATRLDSYARFPHASLVLLAILSMNKGVFPTVISKSLSEYSSVAFAALEGFQKLSETSTASFVDVLPYLRYLIDFMRIEMSSALLEPRNVRIGILIDGMEKYITKDQVYDNVLCDDNGAICTTIEYDLILCDDDESNLVMKVDTLLSRLQESGASALQVACVINRVACYACPASSIVREMVSSRRNLMECFDTQNNTDDLHIPKLLISPLEAALSGNHEKHISSFTVSPLRLQILFSSKSNATDTLALKTFCLIHSLRHSIASDDAVLSNYSSLDGVVESTLSLFEPSLVAVIHAHIDMIIVPALTASLHFYLNLLACSPDVNSFLYLLTVITVLQWIPNTSEVYISLSLSSYFDVCISQLSDRNVQVNNYYLMGLHSILKSLCARQWSSVAEYYCSFQLVFILQSFSLNRNQRLSEDFYQLISTQFRKFSDSIGCHSPSFHWVKLFSCNQSHFDQRCFIVTDTNSMSGVTSINITCQMNSISSNPIRVVLTLESLVSAAETATNPSSVLNTHVLNTWLLSMLDLQFIGNSTLALSTCVKIIASPALKYKQQFSIIFHALRKFLPLLRRHEHQSSDSTYTNVILGELVLRQLLSCSIDKDDKEDVLKSFVKRIPISSIFCPLQVTSSDPDDVNSIGNSFGRCADLVLRLICTMSEAFALFCLQLLAASLSQEIQKDSRVSYNERLKECISKLFNCLHLPDNTALINFMEAFRLTSMQCHWDTQVDEYFQDILDTLMHNQIVPHVSSVVTPIKQSSTSTTNTISLMKITAPILKLSFDQEVQLPPVEEDVKSSPIIDCVKEEKNVNQTEFPVGQWDLSAVQKKFKVPF